ncbi:hypothetical protein GMA11_01195 [Granulicatella sp. zg-ZJ]|uniref:hypothetical protein n=1 Tax=unclassified Granulicatella TaxID=2630493 RepID=UPI0013BF31E2|nr:MULTISPECIES: hypothetical protein [unclassified Granulicatella]MBS4750307.1 hypothetical protein [Carnobacteriaceae bacterium zg-ZUI78]NEW62000.1 hypothetical protein [Granulicatella sp. zg-ZJ]NEW65607.1 hypothetical protein [Granulicatella sp. zg-84]QMI85752.1 hypothetical protein H1220_08695 [Carnobacteriaceae bacterium zg-84]
MLATYRSDILDVMIDMNSYLMTKEDKTSDELEIQEIVETYIPSFVNTNYQGSLLNKMIVECVGKLEYTIIVHHVLLDAFLAEKWKQLRLIMLKSENDVTLARPVARLYGELHR